MTCECKDPGYKRLLGAQLRIPVKLDSDSTTIWTVGA